MPLCSHLKKKHPEIKYEHCQKEFGPSCYNEIVANAVYCPICKKKLPKMPRLDERKTN